MAPSENLHRYSYVYVVELSIPSVRFSTPSNLFTYAHVPFTAPKLGPNNPSHDAKMLLSPISFFLRPHWSGDGCKVWQECRLCCLRGNGPQPQVLWTGSMRGAGICLIHFSFSCTHTLSIPLHLHTTLLLTGLVGTNFV